MESSEKKPNTDQKYILSDQRRSRPRGGDRVEYEDMIDDVKIQCQFIIPTFSEYYFDDFVEMHILIDVISRIHSSSEKWFANPHHP